MTAISSASSAAIQTPGGAASSNVVTVEHGDSLSAIAARHGMPVGELIAANPQIANPNLIYPGDTITVPGGMNPAAPAAPGASTAGAPAAEAQAAGGLSISPSGLDLIKSHEGLRTTAYQDPVGVWTIGYGHTGTAQPGQQISEAQAEELLRGDVGWAQDAVRDKVKVPITQGQFDALVSFTYNLGAGGLAKSDVLAKLNAGDYAGAQAAFGAYVHAGGNVLPGLVRRRNEEAQLFGNQAPQGNAVPTAPAGGNEAPARPATGAHTVVSGDTLSAIASQHGMSLQQVIAANPQIANPNLIYPGQTIHIPGGGQPPAEGPNAGAPATGPGAAAPAGNGTGANAAAIAESFLGRNASELKGSGELPMNPGVPNDLCCANFVSAVLEKNGQLSAGEHTDSVAVLEQTLRNKGWQQVSLADAKPGDVVIMNGNQHTEMVVKNENGQLTLVGSNNSNPDGSQRIGYDNGAWANSIVVLTPGR